MRMRLAGLALAISCLQSSPLAADEGMWLYNNPPREALAKKYGFDLDKKWMDHLQRSSVRFNNGGSGSFVSADGLVLTNHHVGADAIQKLSSAGEDLIKEGFLARQRGDELPTKDLELNVLYEIEDVTERVKSSVRPGMTPAAAEAARRAAKAEIEKESLTQTGLRSDVVTLFRGGAYHLYRYKKYTDIRLVFAPEIGIAFYGGDSANFEYPRYCLDMALFRVYENGRPIQPPAFLKASKKPLEAGDLTFVSGHPGRTERLNTVAHLAFLRDLRYPTALRYIRRMEVALRTYGERSPERKRRAQDDLFGIQNARKAYLGGLEGLQNPKLTREKAVREQSIRAQLAANPGLRAKYGDPYADIEKALAAYHGIYLRNYLIGSGRAFNTRLFDVAETLHRYPIETKKANGKRLREFRDSNLESLKQQLFSSAPVYKDLETVKLADSLSFLLEVFGPQDPLVKSVMAGKSPGMRAAELLQGTHLTDIDVRKQALRGELRDPLLELAGLVDKESRALRDKYESEVSGPLEDAYGRLAQLEYELGMTAGYPDATFTLRLAYGPVVGYKDGGRSIPPFTDIGGLYEKGDTFKNEDPYKIPDSWRRKRSSVNPSVPFNFVHTPDITGGNSGSPVVDSEGELVGLIFDGNIQSLVLDFKYEDEVSRAVSVDVRAIREALRNVYDAGFLADEMGL